MGHRFAGRRTTPLSMSVVRTLAIAGLFGHLMLMAAGVHDAAQAHAAQAGPPPHHHHEPLAADPDAEQAAHCDLPDVAGSPPPITPAPDGLQLAPCATLTNGIVAAVLPAFSHDHQVLYQVFLN